MKGTWGSLIDVQASDHYSVHSSEKKMEVMCKATYRHGREGWVEDTGWADVAYRRDKENSYENVSVFSNETVGDREGRDIREENAAAAVAATAAGGGGGEEKEYQRIYVGAQASGNCSVISGEKKMGVMGNAVYEHGWEGWVEDSDWADVAYLRDKGSNENDSSFSNLSNDPVGEGEGRDRGKENAAAAAAEAAAAAAAGAGGGGGGGGEEKDYQRTYVDVEYDGMHEEKRSGSEWSSGFRNRRGSEERLSSLLFGQRGLLFVVSVLVEWVRRAAKALSNYLLLHLPPSVPRDGISLAVNGTLILGALWLSKTLFQIAITFALLASIAVATVRMIWAARTASDYVFSNGRSHFDEYNEGVSGDGEWTEVNPGTSAGRRSPDGVGGSTTRNFSGRRRPKGASGDGRRMSGFRQMCDRVMQGFQEEFRGGREGEGDNNWTSFGRDTVSKLWSGRGYGRGDDRDDNDDEWDFDSTKPGFNSPRRESEGGKWTDQTNGSFAY